MRHAGAVEQAPLFGADRALVADREQAWKDFSGWRVNYDAVLLQLSGLVMAPYAPWSSDRSVRFRVTVTSWGRRRSS